MSKNDDNDDAAFFSSLFSLAFSFLSFCAP